MSATVVSGAAGDVDMEDAPPSESGCIYNYVVTAHKPTNVTLSVVGHFTSPTDVNLIISKCTRIEIHTLTAEGLQGVVDVPIYGRIATLELFRPQNEEKDLLFLSTERYKFCVLEYDTQSGELVTRANGDIQDRVGRPCDNGQMGLVDPACRIIGLHLYDGLFKVIPFDEKGQLHEAFNIRMEELAVLDLAFLAGCSKPTLAVLYQDTKDARHIKTYEIVVKDKDFAEGPWSQSNLDTGASMIIPVPAPLGGAIVVGETTIAYFAAGQPPKTTSMKQTIVRAYGVVDEDGSRYLLGDHSGGLYLLLLEHDGSTARHISLECLGRVCAPSTLSYLDNGVVYVGSSYGDSQLIRLHPEAPDPAQPGNFVEVLDTFTNLGPIVDLAVVDLERQGQGQVVTCSGVSTDGSLRIVRNGIGMVEQASVELPGIRGVWSLREAYGDSYDRYLVLAFVSETRVLAINQDDELEEADLPGFDAQQQTLWCGNMVGEQVVQVTPRGVRLLAGQAGGLVAQWQPTAGSTINLAAASPSQVLVAMGEGQLVYLEVGTAALVQRAALQLPAEVACLDITPLGESTERSLLAAVGTWNMELVLLALPELRQVGKEALGGEVIPRSVLFAQFDGIPYVLCALGDGHLFNFLIDLSTGQLADRKKISLGTKPITLRTFKSNSTAHVFAASDRPSVIYSSNKKLLYSNVNENEVNFMTSFNSASFPDSLALAKEGSLTIGSIDEIQKLHIRTVPLGEQPRRIAHQEASRTFAVLTTSAIFANEDVGDAIRLLDEQTFETLDRLQLEAYEMACSIASLKLAGDPVTYYTVGTAYAVPDEPEPSKGRVLVLEVREHRLHVVCEKETRGAVYNLNAFQGKLLAGINSRVQLYTWLQRDDGSRELVSECGHSGHVLALYVAARGDFILVGDIMKSMHLLLYKAEEGVLELRARDYHSNWMSAIAMLDDDTYLGAENSFNLFTLRKVSDAASDEERARLTLVGQYHLGEFVNRFQPGSLVMKLPDSQAARIPTVLFGTINGVIGVVASLPPEQFAFLSRLQECLRRVVKGVGGFDHAQWRAFSNERTTEEATNFIDGDLIEQFLDLKHDSMQRVARELGSDATVEELCKIVEELSRLH